MSVEHELVREISKKNNELKKFIKDCEGLNPEKVKKGYDTGLTVDHPFIEGKKASDICS